MAKINVNETKITIFNSPEFEGIKNQTELNRFVLSVKQSEGKSKTETF